MHATVNTDENGDIVADIKGLSGKTYKFYWADTIGVVLDSYTEWIRPTKRHTLKAVAAWCRFRQTRANTTTKPEVIAKVAEAALMKIREQIQFNEGW